MVRGAFLASVTTTQEVGSSAGGGTEAVADHERDLDERTELLIATHERVS